MQLLRLFMAKGDPRPAGCKGVIRDENGSCIIVEALPLGVQSNHLVEAMSAFQTLNIARCLNWKKVWIKGDSNNIIKCLEGEHKTSWTIGYIINDTINTIENFEDCHIDHAYYEVNRVVDGLANLGVQFKATKTWEGKSNLNNDIISSLGYDQINGKLGNLSINDGNNTW